MNKKESVLNHNQIHNNNNNNNKNNNNNLNSNLNTYLHPNYYSSNQQQQQQKQQQNHHHQNDTSSSITSSSMASGSASINFSNGANSLNTMNTNQSSINEKQKKKNGHREVKDGVVHYKKVSTDELKKSIQFGIVHFLNEQNRIIIDRDLLMQDFQVIETIQFPKVGSASTPAHNFSDFKLKVYAPYGFRYLRRKFNVNEVDFMHALGESDLIEVSNPGASGSVFYKTSNDKYILKTVQYQECEFLKTLLAGYALNLLQNLINQKFTLLPTIYGLFCYQKYELTSMLTDRTNIRIVIMNNILPSNVPIHEKYDLKGSLYKRKASKEERAKSRPTFKDLDFLEEHPNGIILDEKNYENIVSSLKRDCLILESFGIMDYSLLLGIHNLEKERNNTAIEAYYEAKVGDVPHTALNNSSTGQNLSSTTSSPASPNLSNYRSSISTNTAQRHLENVFTISAVPAKSGRGERLLLYFGIIDILQSYRLKKKLEHTLKSMITDGSKISVCHPNYYASRFIDFMTQHVFKKAKEGEFKKYGRKIMAALALKGSPSRKRLTFREPKKEDQLSPINDNQDQIGDLNSFKNLKNIKPIDSCDSVAAILTSAVTNHKEAETANKNQEINEIRRRNITPIILHYNDSNATHSSLRPTAASSLNKDESLSTSSISIKIETHSPIYIKSSSNLIKDQTIKTPLQTHANFNGSTSPNTNDLSYEIVNNRKSSCNSSKSRVIPDQFENYVSKSTSFRYTNNNSNLNRITSFTIDKKQMIKNFKEFNS